MVSSAILNVERRIIIIPMALVFLPAIFLTPIKATNSPLIATSPAILPLISTQTTPVLLSVIPLSKFVWKARRNFVILSAI